MVEGVGEDGSGTAERGREAGLAGSGPHATSAMWLWRSLIILGWAAILAGLAMFAWDCLMWLHDGTWSRESVSDLWGEAPILDSPGWDGMRGVHALLHALLRWFGRCPLSLALVAFGLLLAWSGNGWHDRAERELHRRSRRAGPVGLERGRPVR